MAACGAAPRRIAGGTIGTALGALIAAAIAAPCPAAAQPAVAPGTPGLGTPALDPDRADAFAAGAADRRHWEDWFATQTGETRDGARWWSAQRSRAHPAPCQGSADFVTGCRDAQTILTQSDRRRLSDPDYRRGWNSVPAPPDPDRLAPRADPAAWQDGLRDRAAWETWFAALDGDRRAGALSWAAQRSKTPPGTCEQGTPDFIAGCEEARRRLALSDERRHAEADYWRGWNSYGLAPTPTLAPATAATTDAPVPAASGAAPGDCADLGTLGRLCAGATEAGVAAAIGQPLGRLTRTCNPGTSDERDCHAWYYVHDCGRYTLLFDQGNGGAWSLLAAGFAAPASPDQRAQWCGPHG